MRTRVISSIVIGILLLIVLKSGGYVLAAVLCLVSMAAFYELMGASHEHLGTVSQVPYVRGMPDPWRAGEPSSPALDAEGKALLAIGFAGIILHYALLVTDIVGGYAYAGGILFLLIAYVLVYVGRYPEIPVRRVMDALFAFAYSTILLSFIYLLRGLPHGSALVWVPFDAWMCDMGAYLTGRWFGKHKLAPVLSPKKTVEGAVGGALIAAVTGTVFGCLMVFWGYYGTENILPLTFAGLVIGILAQFGDLFASGIKRDTGIKDYGNLIPGHGGIMDRFDSVIFVTPVVYVMLRALVV